MLQIRKWSAVWNIVGEESAQVVLAENVTAHFSIGSDEAEVNGKVIGDELRNG